LDLVRPGHRLRWDRHRPCEDTSVDGKNNLSHISNKILRTRKNWNIPVCLSSCPIYKFCSVGATEGELEMVPLKTSSGSVKENTKCHCNQYIPSSAQSIDQDRKRLALISRALKAGVDKCTLSFSSSVNVRSCSLGCHTFRILEHKYLRGAYVKAT
jgi:hypothetical protein